MKETQQIILKNAQEQWFKYKGDIIGNIEKEIEGLQILIVNIEKKLVEPKPKIDGNEAIKCIKERYDFIVPLFVND